MRDKPEDGQPKFDPPFKCVACGYGYTYGPPERCHHCGGELRAAQPHLNQPGTLPKDRLLGRGQA